MSLAFTIADKPTTDETLTSEEVKQLEAMFVMPQSCHCPHCLKMRQLSQPVHINPNARQLWCGALRSGMWTQIYNEWGEGSTRCAMGVLLAVMGVPPFTRIDVISARTVREWLGVTIEQLDQITSTVVRWNDVNKLSFTEIAERIEKEF
jgi:hypothetical protein